MKGRKRHIIVDIVGNLPHVNLHAANKCNTIAACDAHERASEKYPSIPAYSDYRRISVKFAYEKLNLTLHYSSEKIQDILAVLPKRWLVERAFSWLNNFRRLAKGFEILTWTSENMIRITKCV